MKQHLTISSLRNQKLIPAHHAVITVSSYRGVMVKTYRLHKIKSLEKQFSFSAVKSQILRSTNFPDLSWYKILNKNFKKLTDRLIAGLIDGGKWTWAVLD